MHSSTNAFRLAQSRADQAGRATRVSRGALTLMSASAGAMLIGASLLSAAVNLVWVACFVTGLIFSTASLAMCLTSGAAGQTPRRGPIVAALGLSLLTWLAALLLLLN